MKWILPIILIFLITSTLISLNLEKDTSPEVPEDRPDYLINENQIPSTWTFDLEREIDGRYFLQIKTDQTKAFSIETKEFVTPQETQTFLEESQSNLISSGLELRFYEQSPRVVLDGVDDGYNWEIKSPCCFSRGVTYVIDTYFIYIFGSQESQWEDIELLFNEQTASLLQYLGMEVPPSIEKNLSNQNSLNFPYLGLLAALIVPVWYRRRFT